MRERELTVAGLAATLTLPEDTVRDGRTPIEPSIAAWERPGTRT